MLSTLASRVLLSVALAASASAFAPFASRARILARQRGALRTKDVEEFATIVLLRHGQSEWNEANLFTGWADVELTTLGKNEAAMGATQMWQEGLKIDVAFTSLLKVRRFRETGPSTL